MKKWMMMKQKTNQLALKQMGKMQFFRQMHYKTLQNEWKKNGKTSWHDVKMCVKTTENHGWRGKTLKKQHLHIFQKIMKHV